MIDLDNPRYSAAQVAAASGVDGATFRSYFMRGHFRMVGKTDIPSAGNGVPHKLALRDALGFAVAAELIRNGVKPRDAWEIGLWEFAHKGEDGRDPGSVFDTKKYGLTVLLYWPSTKTARIVPMTRGDFTLDFTTMFHPEGFTRAPAVLAVVLNYLERQVFDALGVNGERTI